eukprot:g4417.t1
MVLAIYANEACVDTIIFGRTGDSEVTLLQMFWMLVPGVATAAITSAICNLVATRLSLPRKIQDRNDDGSWARWKVDHIPGVVQNGVVSPSDDYGMGIGKLARFSPLWCLASGAWLFVTGVMVYVTARGDLTNGLLNLAGLLAVATNTGIPAWNVSKSGSGQDTKSRNVDLVRTVETNVVGNFYDNVAAVTTAVADQEKLDGAVLAPIVLGRTQQYVVANAHATIADYRGEEMDVNYFTSKGDKEQDEARALATAIIAAVNETTKKLSRVLTEAEKGNEATELMTLSAYMCTIADHTAWVGKPAQRRRLLALSMAIAWAMKITGGLGGKIARTESTLKLDSEHEADSCSCCLHRWTVWRPLQKSPKEEMEFLFGRSGHLPEIEVNDKDGHENKSKKHFADQVWTHLMDTVGSSLRNRGLLLYYWIMAMMDNSLLQSYSSMDYFPQASIKVQAFTAEDMTRGCSNSRNDSLGWKPSITADGAGPRPQQQCEVDDEELSTNNRQGRHRLYPHPKTIDHIARRTIFRGAGVQAVIWGIQGLRGLFSG